ncbi:MAG: RseA family anti-sigma factor [Succinimonas sp.]|jgi:negative regulator of sigma E activity|nr:RseA family anti-sigma factor [Succinimonas sp.]
MTKEQQELLSAYFDGAAIDDRTLESLLDDEEVMKEFAAMSEIRAGLRDEIPEGIDFAALSDAVALEVSREPALQPRAANDEDAVPSSEAARAQKKRFSGFSGMWHDMGQIAVAAGVACLCVFGASLWNGQSDTAGKFAEQSYLGGHQAVMASPVTNTSVAPVVTAIPDGSDKLYGGYNDTARHSREAGELEKIKAARKNRELTTLDAILNDHERVLRTVGM